MPARIGVVGAGWWATRAHLPALARHPEAVIAAIADPDPRKRASAAARFEVATSRTYASVSEMLEGTELDGAIVAVPHVHHHAVARELLERRLPVLLEKPMTLDPADARDLEALARRQSVEMVIGYPWQYNVHVRRLTTAIRDGGIGPLEAISCTYASIGRELYRSGRVPGASTDPPVVEPGAGTYSDPAIAGGGQGQVQTTHLAALLLSLAGLRVAEVSAMTAHHGLPMDLVDVVLVRFEGDLLASIASTGSVPEGQEELLEVRLYGADGNARLAITAGQATLHRAGEAPVTLEPLPPSERTPESAPADDLVEVALGRKASGSPGTLGVAAVELVDAMYRSARTRRVVPIGGPDRRAPTAEPQIE